MANEIRAVTGTGNTLYAHIMNAAGQRWNGTTFETYTPANYANYDVSMTEQGASGVYLATFPALLITAGLYEYFVYLQDGGSPAEGDQIINTGSVDWNGSNVSTENIPGAMTGTEWLAYVLQVFKRTDKDTEILDATTDTIFELRRTTQTDEAEIETEVTTAISVLGGYKIPLETDLGLLRGDIVLLDNDLSRPIRKISKEEYDRLYSNPLATNVTMARPCHFCIYAGYIWLGHVPDSITYDYKLNYTKRGGSVTSATTAVPFTNLYRDVLRNGVLYRAFAGLEEDEQASKYKALYEEGVRQIIKREETNRGAVLLVQYRGI